MIDRLIDRLTDHVIPTRNQTARNENKAGARWVTGVSQEALAAAAHNVIRCRTEVGEAKVYERKKS